VRVLGATSTVIGWFQLFQKNRAIGVLDDAFLDVPGAALLIPLFLALFAALRRANQALMAVATSLAVAGVAAYVATNTSISLLYVSDQYWSATTDAQRSLFLAAGQATISAGGYGLLESTGFILVVIAGLIASAVMWKSKLFFKATSLVGILANGFFLANYLINFTLFPASSIESTILIGIASLLMFIWWILIALKLISYRN